MRELTSAIVRLPWAMSLFGIEQVSAVLPANGDAEAVRRATANLYRATQATQDELGDALWAVFQVGDSLQRSAVDLVLDGLTPRRWSLALAQLSNNLEVFNLVKGVRTVLDIPERDPFPLAHLVDAAYALGDFPDLWAIEGLGHDYADRFLERSGEVAGILRNDLAAAIPRSSLTMLHAGIGLSFAKRLLADASPYDGADRVRDLVSTFVTLCRDNSWPGYEGAALESLGLVTRTWHPQMVPPIDRAIGDVDADAREFFWHGVGRALYFHPLYIVPGILSAWRAIDREPPDEIARLNMKAGLAWATTLVNIRQPQILEQLLRDRGTQLAFDDAFADGVASAIVMAQDITRDDEYIASLCAHIPAAPVDDGYGGDLWDRLVAGPCRDASERIQPALAELDSLGEVFRHHPYPGWFDGVTAGPSLSERLDPVH